MERLDDKDVQLLKLLQKNAKLTVKELAAQVNLSASPVFERIKRMEQEGFITQYTAVLNAEKLEKGFTAFCQIKLKQHSKLVGNEFVDAIASMKDVSECYNISGDFDFLLKVQVKDMKHYQNFVYNILGELDSIGGTHTTFAMAEIKNTNGVQL